MNKRLENNSCKNCEYLNEQKVFKPNQNTNNKGYTTKGSTKSTMFQENLPNITHVSLERTDFDIKHRSYKTNTFKHKIRNKSKENNYGYADLRNKNRAKTLIISYNSINADKKNHPPSESISEKINQNTITNSIPSNSIYSDKFSSEMSNISNKDANDSKKFEFPNQFSEYEILKEKFSQEKSIVGKFLLKNNYKDSAEYFYLE